MNALSLRDNIVEMLLIDGHVLIFALFGLLVNQAEGLAPKQINW